MIDNFKVWDKKEQEFIENEEFVIDQNGKLFKLFYEGMGANSFEEMNKDDFEIRFNQPIPKEIIVEDDTIIKCPSCSKEWDLSKIDSCECGATKTVIPKPIKRSGEKIRLKFIARGTSDRFCKCTIVTSDGGSGRDAQEVRNNKCKCCNLPFK